jgi:nicotinate-nucleotide adenylyltransferase
MRLTVFGGTFNPIHIGHLILAEHVRTALNTEKILFIPAHIPPHRENDLALAHHRLKMVELVIKDNPFFEVSDIEFNLPGKSYSFNTVTELYRQYPNINGKIDFITGADALLDIDKWHRADELVRLVRFVALARSGSPDITEIAKAKKVDYIVLPTPIIEVSSSAIRERVKNRQSIRYLVTDPVRKYIEENGLYI